MSLIETLKEKKVRYITVDNVDFFYVEDIEKEFQFFILDAKEIIYIDDIPVIDGKFVHKLSEFDMKMKQILNFKPSKKNKD